MDFETFLQRPAGKRLLRWEQSRFDGAVREVSAGVALQLGMPALECLRKSSCYSRRLVLETGEFPQGRELLRARFVELPLEAESVDLVAMPHTLDWAQDAAATVKEAARVLVPGGRLVVSGFGRLSLWRLQDRCARLARSSVLPGGMRPIALSALRRMLAAEGLEMDRGAFGCYGPALGSEAASRRFDWMDAAGDRWWPAGAGVYQISAVRQDVGMRLVGRVKFAGQLRGAALPSGVAGCTASGKGADARSRKCR